jgi:ElaB/YqjD/DUF883 family membrane-anchored ribosome-binding protein
MKKFTDKKLENANTVDLTIEFKSMVEKMLNDIEELSPKIEELFSDQAFSANHKLVAAFKNLEPAVKGNKRVKDQIHSWLIHQMQNMAKTVEGMKKTVDHVEQNS